MTPEEKAKELVEKFRNELSWIEKDYPVDLWRDAKQCAIVCVEEVIQESLEWNQLESWKERDIFWNEVLTHLKN